MRTEIALLVPSRGRAAWLDELVQSLHDTKTSRARMFVGLDDDDVANYPKQLPGVTYMVSSRRQLGPWTNKLADVFGERYQVLGSVGDDHRFRTEGWDQMVLDGMVQIGDGLVYGPDGLQNESLPTAPFWSTKVIKALGWFFPPAVEHLYADNFWLAMAQRLNRVRYLPGMLIEHMHPAAGKSQMDESYAASSALDKRDHAAFDEYMARQFEVDAKRVEAALNG